MSIIKNTPHILKHCGSPFTTFLNKTLDAIKDPGALGIYVYLASKPSYWEISETNLQNRFEKGRDYIRARLSELKLMGLIKTVAIKDKLGRVTRWETTLYNEVQPTYTHVPENPSSGENSTLLKIHILEKPPTTNNRSKQIKETYNPYMSPLETSPEFQEFWNLYPIKKSEGVCWRFWKKNKLSKIVDQIIPKLKQQIELDRMFLDGYIRNPSKYLREEGWKDAISIQNISKSTKYKSFKQIAGDRILGECNETYC